MYLHPTRDRAKARKGDSVSARLLRTKDEILQFSLDDIQRALSEDLSREKFDQEMMPLYFAYRKVMRKLEGDPTNESCLSEGIVILKKLQAKARELAIPSVNPA